MRRKSPRAPSIPLDDAIERAQKLYEKEKRHPAPVDAIAQHLGYKNATNGAAASVIATLKYYGLIQRDSEKMISVSNDLELYMFSPTEEMKRDYLVKWLKTPPVFSDLLEQYQDHLPSDGTLRFNLIKRGFFQEAADACIAVFRRSVDYARYYEHTQQDEVVGEESINQEVDETPPSEKSDITAEPQTLSQARPVTPIATSAETYAVHDIDRIPVRLTRGRKAWIEIPTPFFAADKERLKAQIDLLLSDDEDDFLE
ncbi:hypothetical protein [Billgrantia aerodenitrificans]|uniref:Uncharacterized protein n=1 Tax=Billgrantia aerodenitrificans TaxID=2733483 RepID=A0ABS9APY9_9GAMM|nr:hypothetical protein [Halomonas aerodenitrificans]MCE8023763.1 hypothetical protein [Halomonas aerodenitrificans]